MHSRETSIVNNETSLHFKENLEYTDLLFCITIGP